MSRSRSRPEKPKVYRSLPEAQNVGAQPVVRFRRADGTPEPPRAELLPALTPEGVLGRELRALSTVDVEIFELKQLGKSAPRQIAELEAAGRAAEVAEL